MLLRAYLHIYDTIVRVRGGKQKRSARSMINIDLFYVNVIIFYYNTLTRLPTLKWF